MTVTGRNILFITTDQQRFDSLGVQRRDGGAHPGGRSPGRRGDQLHAGLQPEHRVHAGALDHADWPVRAHARRGGQRHPAARRRSVDRGVPWRKRADTGPPCWARRISSRDSTRTCSSKENARAVRGDTGPWRGFERSAQAMHAAAWGSFPLAHYGRWLAAEHPEHLHSFAGLLQAEPGGDTRAPETKNNPIPRAWYHTDWVADRTVEWLDSVGHDEPWFCWMSYPDPHHPLGPAGVRVAPSQPAGRGTHAKVVAPA
jgi:hypothetical protein